MGDDMSYEKLQQYPKSGGISNVHEKSQTFLDYLPFLKIDSNCQQV
jgi:hypothetical protein